MGTRAPADRRQWIPVVIMKSVPLMTTDGVTWPVPGLTTFASQTAVIVDGVNADKLWRRPVGRSPAGDGPS